MNHDEFSLVELNVIGVGMMLMLRIHKTVHPYNEDGCIQCLEVTVANRIANAVADDVISLGYSANSMRSLYHDLLKRAI